MSNKKIRNKFKKLKRENVPKKKTLYGTMVNHEFMHIIILQPKKKKKKQQMVGKPHLFRPG